MKRTMTLFNFNLGKGRDRGMIKTKYRDNMCFIFNRNIHGTKYSVPKL